MKPQDFHRPDDVQPFRGGVLPSRVWSQALIARLAQVRGQLPQDLRGVIQFSVEAPDLRSSCFYLRLDGARSSGSDGVADAHDASVVSTEAEVDALLSGQPRDGKALRVSGDFALFQRCMQLLSAPAR